jgi:hypothetical protein
MKAKLFVFFFLIFNTFASAQNAHGWWYIIHHHDGVTPWQRYLVLSPAYMGPNAFPIPDIRQGEIKNKLEFESAIEGHFNSHEQTENLYTRLSIPLLKNKVELAVFVVPYEIYSYDTLIRDERFSRNYEGKGHANGDLYISTNIQLIKDRVNWPDLMLGINLKTASGNDFGSARYSDSPGYFFNLNAGKTYTLKNKKQLASIRFYAMLGFYVWQTNLADHMQDDALLYGAGFRLNYKSFHWSNEVGGLYGYLNNGDKPFVARTKWQSNRAKKLNFGLQFEYGIKDYNFRSIRFSLLYTPSL